MTSRGGVGGGVGGGVWIAASDIAVLRLVVLAIAVLARRRLPGCLPGSLLGSMLAQQLAQVAGRTHQPKVGALLGDAAISHEDDVVALWDEADRMGHQQPCSRAQQSMRPNHAVE